MSAPNAVIKVVNPDSYEKLSSVRLVLSQEISGKFGAISAKEKKTQQMVIVKLKAHTNQP